MNGAGSEDQNLEERLNITYQDVKTSLDNLTPNQMRKILKIDLTPRELEEILYHKDIISKNKAECAIAEAVRNGANIEEASKIFVEPLSMKESVCSYFVNKIEEHCRNMRMRFFNSFQINMLKEYENDYFRKRGLALPIKSKLRWIKMKGKALRTNYESFEESGFHVLDRQLKSRINFSRFCTELAKYLNKIDCDILVSRESSFGKDLIKDQDCTIRGKKFVNIERYDFQKCVNKLKRIGGRAGDYFVFLFYGSSPKQFMKNVPNYIAKLIVKDMLENSYSYPFN